MGRLKVTSGSHWGERPLATSTVIGRHWSCDILLQAPEVPLRWIELRWIEEQWGWRALSREGDTIGAGAWLRPGWRVFGGPTKASRTLRLREIVTLELMDETAPEPYAVDLQSGQVVLKQALVDLLASAGMHRWRTPLGDPLNDGAVLVIEGRPIRLHLPQRAHAAAVGEVPSILHTDTLLKLDSKALTGALEHGPLRIDLPSEFVLLLLPYAEARVNEYAYEDAWLGREEAHARWIELGGNVQSSAQRLGWVRGKLKSYLARKGLADLDNLFESRRFGDWYGTRLGLQREQIVLT